MHLDAPDLVTVHEIPGGRAGVAATLRAMRDIVREARTDFFIRQTTQQVIANVLGKDWRGEADAVFQWVRNNIRYTMDPVDVETLHTPAQVLFARQGDCDDFSILLAAMLRSIGHPVAFKAVGFQAGELTHVYVLTLIGERWIALDATEAGELGWEPDGIADYKIQKV